jgi:hypothetical protein
VTAIRSVGRSGFASATSAESHCVSRISKSRLFSWMSALGSLAEPVGENGVCGRLPSAGSEANRAPYR